jgi:hypothetical protein
MNKRQIKELDGTTVKIRPPVTRRWPGEDWLPERDDDWLLSTWRLGPRVAAELRNVATGHVLSIYSDSVHEYRETGHLVLKEQIAMVGLTIEREPLPDMRLAYAAARRLRPDAMN